MTKKVEMKVPYFQVSNNIFEIGLEKHELLVYFYLARCGNNGAKAFPSYQTIADKCGMSRSKAIRTIKTLEGRQLIKKKVRKGFRVKNNKSNTYVVEHNIQADKPEDVIEKGANVLMGAFKNAGAEKEDPDTKDYIKAAIGAGIKRREEKNKWTQGLM